MDKAEITIATKRISRWSAAWREDVLTLPPREREVLMELAAFVDARPTDDVASDR